VFYEKVEEIEHPKKMNAHPPNKFVVLLLQYFSLKANILYKSTHDTFLSKKSAIQISRRSAEQNPRMPMRPCTSCFPIFLCHLRLPVTSPLKTPHLDKDHLYPSLLRKCRGIYSGVPRNTILKVAIIVRIRSVEGKSTIRTTWPKSRRPHDLRLDIDSTLEFETCASSRISKNYVYIFCFVCNFIIKSIFEYNLIFHIYLNFLNKTNGQILS
jgi:hypothetical protein